MAAGNGQGIVGQGIVEQEETEQTEKLKILSVTSVASCSKYIGWVRRVS